MMLSTNLVKSFSITTSLLNVKSIEISPSAVQFLSSLTVPLVVTFKEVIFPT